MPNVNNEYLTKDYIIYLKEAHGRSESTIKKIKQIFRNWDLLTNSLDFKKYDKKQAIAFKSKLREKKYNGKPISIATVKKVLNGLKYFLIWLHNKPGYKRAISLEDIEYLSVTLKESRMAEQPKQKEYYTSEQVKMLIESIKGDSVEVIRNRALICFLYISGIRIEALTTMKIGDFSKEDNMVYQNPQNGVKTKNSKLITTFLFTFDKELVDIFINYYDFLLKQGFGYSDPLFPTLKEERLDGLSFKKSNQLSNIPLGQNGIRKILKFYSEKAGLKYYSPHHMRDSVVNEASKRCKNMEELKAVSTNIGHSQIITTFLSYAPITIENQKKIILNLDYKNDDTKITEGVMREFMNQFMKSNSNDALSSLMAAKQSQTNIVKKVNNQEEK